MPTGGVQIDTIDTVVKGLGDLHLWKVQQNISIKNMSGLGIYHKFDVGLLTEWPGCINNKYSHIEAIGSLLILGKYFDKSSMPNIPSRKI